LHLVSTHACAGWLLPPIKSGFLCVIVYARTATGPDESSNFDEAAKKNINGIVEVRITVQHSEDGVSNLQTSKYRYPVHPVRSDFTHVNPIAGNDFWKVNLGAFYIPLASQGVPESGGVTVEIRNFFGWSPVTNAVFFGSDTSVSVEFMGPADLQPQQAEAPDGSNEVFPNLAGSKDRVVDSLSAAATVMQPEYRGAAITKGAASEKARGGEEFTVFLRCPAAGTCHPLSFDSMYIGLEQKPPMLVNDWYTAWTFRAIDDSTFVCTGYTFGEWPH